MSANSQWAGNLKKFDHNDDLAPELAREVARRLNEAINVKGSASVAFSGGNTPKTMLQALSGQKLDWDKVSVTLVDDRCVAASSDRSNAGLLQRNFIDLLPVQPHFFSLFTEGESLQAAKARLAGFPLPFDCIVLGMGGDAHTASFFPDASNIAEMIDLNNSALLANTQSEASVELRLTWTLTALLKAEYIVLHLCGNEKWPVLEQVRELLEKDSAVIDKLQQKYPIASVLRHTQLKQAEGIPASIYYAESS